jgi:DNA-binding CsgD family transcriptional regulator
MHHPAAVRLAFRGQIDDARSALEMLRTMADGRGEVKSHHALTLHLCELDLRAGDTRAARRRLDHWEHVLGDPNGSELEARLESLLAALRGVPDETERWAARVGGEVGWNALEAGRARGIAALCAGDPSRAQECLRGVWDHTQREGVHDPGAFPIAPDLVEALIELDQRHEAIAVADRLAELSEQQGHPWGLASAKRCRAVIGLERAYDPEGAALLAEAADDYAGLGLRFDLARSLLALGRAERRHRKWGAARATLEQATAAFDETGSIGWADLARAELARVGARRPAPEGELTPAERRVGELAAAGASNKEIAKRLSISVPTVERHLSHIYGKLGLTSRAQLAHVWRG